MPELRKDPVLGRWVIIATERGKRPSDFKHEAEGSKQNPGNCPFCPGNEEMTPPEVMAVRPPGSQPDSPGWKLRVIPNKFPALKIEGQLGRKGVGLYDKMNGVGAHEVVIENPDHGRDLDARDIEENFLIYRAYRERIVDLMRDDRFEYILVFRNFGLLAGASLSHPHSQIIATPILPKRVTEELYGTQQHYRYKKRCIFCDILDQELMLEERVVLASNHFLVVTPFASSHPFELWIVPTRHQADYTQASDDELRDLAGVMTRLVGKYKKTLGEVHYNYIVHTTRSERALEENFPYGHAHYHWHIEMFPRLTRTAGFEWGTGFYINPTPPEEAARYLREVG
jgi:UDPglucose--hexose-1-phosphate uridylyltransferase